MARKMGFALIWVAVTLLILVGFVGLSVDWGKVSWNIHQMQNAADAAALAGAHVVKYDQEDARDRAVALAWANLADQVAVSLDRNEANDPLGELVLGRWIRQDLEFIPTTEAPNAVAVNVHRLGQRDDAPPLKMVFGGAFGVEEVQAGRLAIAWSQGSSGAGIITLEADPHRYWDYGWRENNGSGFVRDGGCDVDLRGPDGIAGDIQVNATELQPPKPALNLDGRSGKIWAGEINVVGSTDPDPDSDTWSDYYGDPELPFSVNPRMPRINDPLAALNDNPPDIARMTQYASPAASGGQVVTIEPGWYPEGLNPEGGTIVMQPGTYAVGGGTKPAQVSGLVFNGGTLQGQGVTIYITGDPDGTQTGTKILYGQLDIGAKGTANLWSPGDANPDLGVDGLPGVVLWQDINNHNEATVIGSPTSDLRGTLYFPDNPVHLGGGTEQMGSQVIAGALHIHGNVTLRIAYDGRNMVKARRSILVQ